VSATVFFSTLVFSLFLEFEHPDIIKQAITANKKDSFDFLM
jgi:hypothetical protein